MLVNEYKIIKKSGLFDKSFYLRTYADVRKADIDPIKHYIKYGWREGRNPSQIFDTNAYIEQNSNVVEQDICPLTHMILKKKIKRKQELVTLLKNLLSKPKKLIKQLNRHNINKLVYHIKKGNFSLINEKIIFYTASNPKKMDLDLIETNQQFEVLEFARVENPLVSIVIPVYNQFEFTYKCLKSILDNTHDVEYEIIIADDVSNDETINIKNYIDNITVVHNEKNLGFLLNCNNAAKYAKGKYIHFLNNDTQVQKAWLSSLVTLIASNEKIGMVGSKLVYPDGRQQEAGGIIWNDASGWNYGRLDDPTKPEYNYVKEVDYISGASILIKTDLWKEIGGFDERYIPAYYEDSDLAFEVRKHGYKVMFQPQSIVVHFEGISNGTDLGSGIKKYQVVNNQKFLEKWKDTLTLSHKSNAQDVFLSRDKSINKKHLLFVDHYLPHYDQDAGSKATFQYLQMFVDMGYHVHFIGDNFWHYPETPYLEKLTQMGIEVLYGNWYAQNWQSWFKDNGKYFEYVILSRPHIAVKYIDIIKEFSDAKIIYFGHDLHFLREKREYELKKEIKLLENSQNWEKEELSLMRKSDVSYYFSNIEKDVIQEVDKSIKVDVVPLYIFNEYKTIHYSSRNRQDIMFVGGFAHSPNIDAVLWFIEKVFPKIKNQIPDIKFYIIGSKVPKEIKNLSSDSIIVTGFISDSELEDFYSRSKLVVAPLRYGAGVKGKIIDALYYGMPIVTTTIGSEGIQNANNIMKIADDASAFADNVIELYNNEERLKYFSDLAQDACQKYFSINYAKSQINNFFAQSGIKND